MTDRELLELVAKAAIKEHAAWVFRNTKRNELNANLRRAGIAQSELSPDDFEADEWQEWEDMRNAVVAAQRKLNSARQTTRRAIVRAAAAIGEAMKP